MVDISKIDSSGSEESPAFLHLEDAEGNLLYADEAETQKVGIWLLGADSKTSQKYQRKLTQKALRGRKTKTSAEDVRNQSTGLYVALSNSFDHIEMGGSTLSVGDEDLMKKFYEVPFIRRQVEAFIHDASNWLGEPSTT